MIKTRAAGCCLVCFLIGQGVARATEVRLAADGRYFTDVAWFGEGSYANAWTSWVQAHRTVARRPSLAPHGHSLRPNDWRRLGVPPPFEHGGRPRLKLFTLQLAAYRSSDQLRAFVRGTWVRQRMPSRRLYTNLPKALRLYLGGDVEHKDDPLYTVEVREGGVPWTRLRYGIYENAADAERDGRALMRLIGVLPWITTTPLSDTLPVLVWGRPVAGSFFNEWDEQARSWVSAGVRTAWFSPPDPPRVLDASRVAVPGRQHELDRDVLHVADEADGERQLDHGIGAGSGLDRRGRGE